MKFRVAETPGARKVEERFDLPVTQYGRLTPEMVRDKAKEAKIMHLQVQLTTAINRFSDSILKDTAKIEALTLKAIESGLTTDEEIEGYKAKAIKASANHDAKIAKIRNELAHELNLIQAKSASDTSLANLSFQQKLRLMQANHGSQQQILANGFEQQLRVIQASPQLAFAAQNQSAQLDAYINARDFVPALGSSSSQSNKSTGGGFLNGLFNFFTGRN